MHRRATSKKWAAEAEKEIDMDDKEATPVEDVEGRLPPAEPNQPAQQEEQPEKPTQTGDVNFQETMMRVMMEMKEDNKKAREENQKSIESINKNIESVKGDNQKISHQMAENSKKIDDSYKKLTKTLCQKMDDMTKKIINDNKPVSYTHLDVYKRQA